MKPFIKPSRPNFEAIKEIVNLLMRHRELTWEMTKREIADRYLGQALGMLWALGHPLILMGVYIFIFAGVFKVKIGGTRELPLDYTTYLLSGLIPWMTFQESMSKAVTAISNNASLVKQVVFPLEILPIKVVLASFLTQLVSSVVFLIYVYVRHGFLPWSYLLLPVLFFFQILAMIGVAYVLSAVGAYFRDLKDFVQVFSIVGMYLTPIFYLPAMVPLIFKPLLYLNPFSYMTWCYQDILYFGRFEHPWAWVVGVGLAAVTFCGGYRVFEKLRIMFGDVL